MNKKKILHSMKHIGLAQKMIQENLDYIFREIAKDWQKRRRKIR